MDHQLATDAAGDVQRGRRSRPVRGEAFRLAMLDAGVLLPPYAITDCRVCLAFTDDVDQTIDAARWALGRLDDQ